jgi:acetyl-CoA carboxylase biotin carboxylase subunit
VFDSLLVANRGEIARRVLATARRMGIRTVAVYSAADADLPFVREADEAVPIGPPPPARSYLDQAAILDAARRTGAQAIHPGYGFLSENADFAGRVAAAGLTWVGPPPAAIEQMGDKINARNLMAAAGVPVAAGTAEPVTDAGSAVAAAAVIGYPVMVKAAAGGGGIGMSAAADDAELRAAFETARSRAERFFGSPDILLERYVIAARHVEVQILGLASGQVLALGERDCSVQRRHQKVAEETPSPGVSPELRGRLQAAAVRAGQVVGYRGAGTVEFLVDSAGLAGPAGRAGRGEERRSGGSGGSSPRDSTAGRDQEFYFLEMNTRLQVEHPVTELVTGIDLVEQQLRIAAGGDVSFAPGGVQYQGHALELRVYAEDPRRFLPSPGTITEWAEPAGPGIRVDAGYAAGNQVTPFYDPLLAKLCVSGADRDEALHRARDAVASFRIGGLKTNLPFHADLLNSEVFSSGDYDTSVVSRLRP